jgi:hypothetical protein
MTRTFMKELVLHAALALGSMAVLGLLIVVR